MSIFLSNDSGHFLADNVEGAGWPVYLNGYMVTVVICLAEHVNGVRDTCWSYGRMLVLGA